MGRGQREPQGVAGGALDGLVGNSKAAPWVAGIFMMLVAFIAIFASRC